MANDDRTVKAYVESITEEFQRQEVRLRVKFRLEWPNDALSLVHEVSVSSSYEHAVDDAWDTIESRFNEIREPERIELIRHPSLAS